MNKEKKQRIQVYVRCRPLNLTEKKSGSVSVVDVIEGKKEINVRERLGDKEFSKKFTFDKVFGPDAEQVAVYNAVARPCIEEVLLGYNCTIFAYGQTSTGKTHTMQGMRSDETCSWEEDPEVGIIPRTLHHLFTELQSNYPDYTVRISFLELYNEELNDLLNSSGFGSKLRLYEDITRKGSVVIQGLTEFTVYSKEEVYSILEAGIKHRKTACTALNDQSSRSHTIFSITVHIKECTLEGEDVMKIGKLNLVDLAGSECIGRSGAVDRRAREAGNINQSLLTLGRVITALVEKTPHVPYRESKLTRLLQDSLGGRTKTSIVATISPATCNLEETLSTLDYAYRAKDITNKPEVNQKMTKKMLIREYTEEMERLRKDLIATAEKRGIFMTEENHNFLQFRLVGQEDDIKEKKLRIDALSEEFEKLKMLFGDTKGELDCKVIELQENQEKLLQTTAALDETAQTLEKTALEREEQCHIVKSQVKTERLLTDQSVKLIGVAEESTRDVGKLYDKLDRKGQLELTNCQISFNFIREFQNNLLQLEDRINGCVEERCKSIASLAVSLDDQLQFHRNKAEYLKQIVGKIVEAHGFQLTRQSQALSEQERLVKDWAVVTRSVATGCGKAVVACDRSYLNERFGPPMLAALALLQKHASAASQIQKMLTEKLTALEEKLCQHKNKMLFFLNQLKEDLEPLLDADEKEMKFCSGALESLNSSRQEFDTFLEEMQQEVDRFFSTMASMKVKLELQKPFAETSRQQISSSLMHFKSTTETLPAIADRHGANFQCDITNFTQSTADDAKEILLIAKDQFEKEAVQSGEMRSRFEDLDSAIITNSGTTVQNVGNFHSAVHNAVNTYNEISARHLEERQRHLEEMSETVQDASDEHSQATLEHSDETCARMELHNNTIAAIRSGVSDVQSAVGEYIHAQDVTVDRFLHRDLQKYLPSGETPQRKDYVFSRELAATSPHESIIERFHQSVPGHKLSIPSNPPAEERENKDQKKPITSSVPRSTNKGRKPLQPPNFEM